MKEQNKRTDRSAALARTGFELLQEYNTSTDEWERRTILAERRAIDTQQRRALEQQESLDQLPDLWEAL